jgi:hypothetical protein
MPANPLKSALFRGFPQVIHKVMIHGIHGLARVIRVHEALVSARSRIAGHLTKKARQ